MKTLTEDAVRFYREQGYYAPLRAISMADATDLRRRLEAFEARSPTTQIGVRFFVRASKMTLRAAST